MFQHRRMPRKSSYPAGGGGERGGVCRRGGVPSRKLDTRVISNIQFVFIKGIISLDFQTCQSHAHNQQHRKVTGMLKSKYGEYFYSENAYKDHSDLLEVLEPLLIQTCRECTVSNGIKGILLFCFIF